MALHDPETYEVTVGPEHLMLVQWHGSVVVATGTWGNTYVTFVGDVRPMGEFLRTVLDSGQEQTATVESWQVQTIRPIAKGA